MEKGPVGTLRVFECLIFTAEKKLFMQRKCRKLKGTVLSQMLHFLLGESRCHSWSCVVIMKPAAAKPLLFLHITIKQIRRDTLIFEHKRGWYIIWPVDRCSLHVFSLWAKLSPSRHVYWVDVRFCIIQFLLVNKSVCKTSKCWKILNTEISSARVLFHMLGWWEFS